MWNAAGEERGVGGGDIGMGESLGKGGSGMEGARVCL